MAKEKWKIINTDLLVLGAGVAGTFAAIKAKEAGVENITVVSKGLMGHDSISAFAAGVYDVFDPDQDDRDAEFERRALADYWGAGLYDEEWLNILLDENKQILLDLESWGVDWERTSDGKIQRYPMKRKIMRAMFHGPQMMKMVGKKVKDSGIQYISHTMITDLLTEGGKPESRVVGAVGFEVRTGEFRVFQAKTVVLAAGGCGFKGRFSCHKFQTGEAHVMAYRAGAQMGHFEQEGLHTTPMEWDMHGMNMFQGLGGVFVNAEGQEFLHDYDPELGNNTTMELFSVAMVMEDRAGRGPVYLDMTMFTPEQVRQMKAVGPMYTKMLERNGTIVGDKVAKKIEYGPAFFGNVCCGGGVVVNHKGETSLPGLISGGDAIAQVANQRSLQGATVTGVVAGRTAAKHVKEAKEPVIDMDQVERHREFAFAPLETKEGIDPHHVFIGVLEAIIPAGISVLRRADHIENSLKEIERIRDTEVPLLHAVDPHSVRLVNEAKNCVQEAEWFMRSALLRTESRGQCCIREDYPYCDNINWLKWTMLKQIDGRTKIWTVDAGIDKYKVQPKKERYIHPLFEVADRRGVKWG
jgi:succinate dehydrogenase/fumarate reductase flavoprotein subunit